MSITISEFSGIGPSNTSQPSRTLNASGVTNGTLMLACLAIQDVTTITSPASGWALEQLADATSSGATRCLLYTYSKTSTGSEGSHTWTYGAGCYSSATGIAILGSGGTITAATKVEATSNPKTLPGVTVEAGGAAVLIMGITATTDTTSLADYFDEVGWTNVVDRFGTQRSSIAVYYKNYPSGGATGDITITGAIPNPSAVLLAISAGDPALGASVADNGFDITVASTNTDPANYAVEAGVIGSETSRTVQSVRQISSTQVRLRLANGDRIFAGDSVLISSTADAIVDDPAANNSKQTSTTVWHNRIVWGFASPPIVGITAAGEPQVTDAVAINSITYDNDTGEEQYRINGSMINPTCGPGSTHPFHPDATGYSSGVHVALPLTLSLDQCLVSGASFPDVMAHATATSFVVGDVIEEQGRFFRCTTAGATAEEKPTFSSGDATKIDGSAIWTRGASGGGYGLNGRSLVRRIALLWCPGLSLASQDTYRPAFSNGATKTRYSRDDLVLNVLPNDAGAHDIVVHEGLVQNPWWELGFCEGGAESEAIPEEQMPCYGETIQTTACNAIVAAMSGAPHRETLVDLLIQRGIDQIGMREAGLYIQGFEGWSQGRIAFALFAAKLLGVEDTIIPMLRSHVNGAWRGTEFAEQVGYVDAVLLSATQNDSHDYGVSGSGTYVDPTQTPVTYGDSPSNAYFPASVRGSWLHVPEWGGRFARTPAFNTPRWSLTEAFNNYRRCCTATAWGALAYICLRLDLIDLLQAGAFFDYMDRYYLIGADDNFSHKTLWDTHYTPNRPAFRVTSAVASDEGSALTLTFSRYATGTNDGLAFTIPGKTLGSATFDGPRSLTFSITPPAQSGDTLAYDDETGDVVSADGTFLSGFSGQMIGGDYTAGSSSSSSSSDSSESSSHSSASSSSSSGNNDLGQSSSSHSSESSSSSSDSSHSSLSDSSLSSESSGLSSTSSSDSSGSSSSSSSDSSASSSTSSSNAEPVITPMKRGVITGPAYLSIARSYATIRERLLSVEPHLFSPVETIVMSTDLYPNLDLLQELYATYLATADSIAATTKMEPAVKALQDHVTKRSPYLDVRAFIQEQIIDAGLADGVPEQWAVLSKAVGYNIDSLIEP